MGSGVTRPKADLRLGKTRGGSCVHPRYRHGERTNGEQTERPVGTSGKISLPGLNSNPLSGS